MRWYNRLRWKVAKLKEVAITNWRKNISRPTSRHLSSWFPTSSLSCVTCVTFFWFLKQDFHDWRIWENSLNLPPKLWTPGTTPPRIVGAGSSGAGGKLKMSWVSPSRHWQVLVGGGWWEWVISFVYQPKPLSDSNSCVSWGIVVSFVFCLFQLFDLARLRELGEAAQRKALAWDELAYGRGLLGILCP